MNPLESGQSAAFAVGIQWRDVPADGHWHEVPAEGKGPRNGAGRIRLFADGEGGQVWNHITGDSTTFWTRSEATLDPVEREARRKRAAELREQAEAERQRAAEAAASLAAALWKAGRSAEGNPYLARKGVAAVTSLRQIDAGEAGRIIGYAPRIGGEELTGPLLLAPIKSDGRWSSVQLIAGDGRKYFLPGGALKGGFWATGPMPPGNGEGLTFLLAEGVATALSVHESTGGLVLAGMSCGNLPAVARWLRGRYPQARIIVCSDRGNGEDHARRAAVEAGALLAVPVVDGDGTDFNDLHQSAGLEAVRRQIDAARPIPTPSPTAKNPSDGKSRNRLDVLKGSDVTIEPINWLWHGWLPAGKLTILAGAPGTGKTTIAGELAAILTAGGTWPDGTPAPCADVAIWSGEDDPGDTLAPRLLAAGADLDRVHFVRGVNADDGPRPFDPASDVAALRLYLAQNPAVKLLIVDPISSAVAGDSHKNTEVRRGLQPLVELAATCGVAVLGISHFSKGTSGRDPLERVTGSIAFGALARVVLAAAKLADSEDDMRLFCRSKSNIGPDSGGWQYQLATTELDGFPGVVTSRIQWGAAVEGSARELLEVAEAATDNEERTARSEARHFLTEILSGGPMSAKRVLSEARDCGIAEKTIRRAKTDLAIEVLKTGFKDGWQWSLPKAAKGGQLSTSKKHGHLAHLRDELTTFDAPKMAKSDEDGQDSRKIEWTPTATLAGRGDDDCPEFDW